MKDLILHPDVQFSGPADIETAVYGEAFEARISRSRDFG
jgi:hypothetical protein